MNKTFNIKEKIQPQVFMIPIFIGLSECVLIHLVNTIINISGRDAWLVSLIGSLFSFLLVYLLVTLANRFPAENFFQYSLRVWGRPISYLIAISYFLFWLTFMVLFIEDTIHINKIYFLQRTPALVQMIFLFIGGVWLISYGFINLVRFFQVMFPFLIFSIMLGIVLSLQNLEISSFLPILGNGFLPIIKGSIIYFGFLQGIEVIIFTYPFFYKGSGSKKVLLKRALAGVGLLNLIAFLHIVISIGVLGVVSTKEMLWANFAVLELIEVPGFAAERFDLLFTIAWLISLFCAGNFFYYLASYGLIQVFNLKHKKMVIFLVGLVSSVIAYIIPNYSTVIIIWQNINYISITFIFIIPFLTLILAILRKKGGQNP